MNTAVRSARRSTLVLVVLAGATTASAQVRTICGDRRHCVNTSMTLNHSYAISASGCTGTAAAWAAAYDMGVQYQYEDELNCGVPPISTDMYFDADAGSKPGSGCNADATAGNSEYGGYGHSDVDWACTSGTTFVKADSKFCSGTLYNGAGDYLDYINLGMGSSGGGGQKIFTVSGPVTWSSAVDATVSLAFGAGYTTGGLPVSRAAFFVSETVQGSGSPTTRQGLYVFPSGDDAPIPLGFFTGVEAEIKPTKDGYTLDLSSEFEPSVTHSGTVTYTFKYDLIGGFDGNMNPEADGTDQIVCYTDRAILYGLLGTSLGNASYNPRGDLDQDGDIDAADLAIFNTLPCNANWDCSTTAPRINAGDYSAFMNGYGGSDPVCDMNGNSLLDAGDFMEFMNAAAAGCQQP